MELPVKAPISPARKILYRLETKNLSYRLCGNTDPKLSNFCGLLSDKEEKVILKDVSCDARSAEITAIAGPSGAGKTTLLEILAGKVVSHGKVSGQVLVNGSSMDGPEYRRVSGFVPQEDALFPYLTVQETLTYSALLRLKTNRKEAVAKVKRLIQELGLKHVADSRIGQGSRSGISGGERRRVSIGVELVHDPNVILIDEPTSGLDSASALQVVMLLKDMTVKQGKTIVLTIHQPGFRILEQIDRIVLLSNGLVVQNGPVNSLHQKIKLSGHQIPWRVNVLEYAVDIAASFEPILTRSCREISSYGHNKTWKSFRNNSGAFHRSDSHNNSVLEEVQILGQRSCKNIFRTKQLFTTRALQASIAGFILGSVYLNVGNQKQEAKVLRTGFFAFTLTFLLSSTTEGLPIFLQDRRILMRETSRRAYRVLSYVLADTLIFIPFLLIISMLFATPVYWLVGLRRELDGFLYFSLVIWIVLLMSNAFVACFSALVPNFIMGTSVISGLMESFFLFSGYFIAKERIPVYWEFMNYLSLFKYPFECLMINEYQGDVFLKQQDLNESRKWSNLGIMTCFIVGYRVLGFFILWYRCYRTEN